MKLVERGITKGPFRIENLVEISQLLARKAFFRVVSLKGKRFVVDPKNIKLPKAIAILARKTVGRLGVASISDITAQVEEANNHQVTPDFVIKVVSLARGFNWLDETGGWFWLATIPEQRNPLLNVIQKILSVSGEIEVSELRSGIGRYQRMEGFVPPRRVLLELCRQLPWCRVEDTMIVADPPLNWEQGVRLKALLGACPRIEIPIRAKKHNNRSPIFGWRKDYHLNPKLKG